MAASSKKRVCWDACAWIAFIQREKIIEEASGKIIENRYAMCREIIDLAEGKDKKIEIVVSGLCLVEVTKHPDIKTGPIDLVAQYLDADHILVVPVDRQVGMKARELMRAGYPKLKPQDATHLASAIVANADELHTFDEALLALTGKCTRADGKALTVCKPSTGGPLPPLLAVVANSQTAAKG